MSFQFSQLIFLLLYVGIGIAIWKIKSTKFRIGLVIFGFIIFLVNPIRFKQGNMGSIERFSSIGVDIPSKVVIESKSFTERQQSQYDKLKSDSKEIISEVSK